jgi:alkylhydroperoxidase/carboxymuconolactone decarboxylase family protein YurZ
LLEPALTLSAGHEGAVPSYTRGALVARGSATELRRVVLVVTTPLGFLDMIAALTRLEDTPSQSK